MAKCKLFNKIFRRKRASQDYYERTKLVGKSLGREAIDRLLRNKLAMIGLIMLILMGLMAIFADVLAPYDYTLQNIKEKLQSPSLEHLAGTDQLGRDLLSRIMYGARVSLVVGLMSALIGMVFGVTLGAIAGFYGGAVDNVIMRILDIVLAVPHLLLALCISATMGGGIVNCMIAVGVSFIPNFARTIRGPILAVKEEQYIEAARVIDASDFRIIFKHVLPNVLSPLIVQTTMSIASAITTAASLSFVGLGVQPPTPEWGSMISIGRQYIRDASYMVTAPGLALAYTIVALNLFGDGLRDALDPRLRD